MDSYRYCGVCGYEPADALERRWSHVDVRHLCGRIGASGRTAYRPNSDLPGRGCGRSRRLASSA